MVRGKLWASRTVSCVNGAKVGSRPRSMLAPTGPDTAVWVGESTAKPEPLSLSSADGILSMARALGFR